MKIASFAAISATVILLGAGCGGSKTKIPEVGTSGSQQPKAPVVQQSVTITTPNALPSFTLSEVAAHATSTDCWLAIHDNVYDISVLISKDKQVKPFIADCGKEASTSYDAAIKQNTKLQDAFKSYEIGLFQK